MNREELAWSAGFFDGEGHIRNQIRKNAKNPNIRISVNQIDRRPLDRLAAALGVGKVYGPYIYNPTNKYSRKPIYYFLISNYEHVQHAITLLWTWLSEPKREQASGVLLAARDYKFGRGGGTHGPRM